jgi:hypothetical protein
MKQLMKLKNFQENQSIEDMGMDEMHTDMEIMMNMGTQRMKRKKKKILKNIMML